MKIAFTSQGKTMDSQIDPRFGRCPYFLVLNTENNDIEIVDNTKSAEDAHGAGPKTAQRFSEANCKVLITGNGPGGNAARVLEKMNVQVYTGANNKTVQQAYDEYKKGNLSKL